MKKQTLHLVDFAILMQVSSVRAYQITPVEVGKHKVNCHFLHTNKKTPIKLIN